MREFEIGTRCYCKTVGSSVVRYVYCKVIERSTSTAMLEVLGGNLDGYRFATHIQFLSRERPVTTDK